MRRGENKGQNMSIFYLRSFYRPTSLTRCFSRRRFFGRFLEKPGSPLLANGSVIRGPPKRMSLLGTSEKAKMKKAKERAKGSAIKFEEFINAKFGDNPSA